MKNYHFILSGALAGSISAFTFAAIHALFISDIWYSLSGLMVAGAICGLCLAGTFGILFEKPSLGNWLRYNSIYVGMFVLIGSVSALLFEPVTTIPELMHSAEPPAELYNAALPMTVVSTLIMAAIIGKLYGRTWKHYGAILLTCTVLVILLGLNVSVIGLVSIPRSSVYIIAELFGLIFALNAVYVLVFWGFERKRMRRELTT